MPNVTTKTSRIRGPAQRVTALWQDDVWNHLKQRDWTPADLARKLDIDKSILYRLLDRAKHPPTSRHVATVNSELGIVAPSSATTDVSEGVRELLRLGLELEARDPERFRMVRQNIRDSVRALNQEEADRSAVMEQALSSVFGKRKQ
jgi:hypothetical protein